MIAGDDRLLQGGSATWGEVDAAAAALAGAAVGVAFTGVAALREVADDDGVG